MEWAGSQDYLGNGALLIQAKKEVKIAVTYIMERRR
jgi:hypothetical protein